MNDEKTKPSDVYGKFGKVHDLIESMRAGMPASLSIACMDVQDMLPIAQLIAKETLKSSDPNVVLRVLELIFDREPCVRRYRKEQGLT